MKKLIQLFIILFIFTGCKTIEVDTQGESKSLYGVVFDMKSNPLKNARIKIMQNEMEDVLASTDIDGQFYIPELEFGNYTVEVNAKDCATTVVDLEHYDIENVIVIRIPTYQNLISDFEEYLKENNLIDAEKTIGKVESINDQDIYYKYLKAIYYLKIEDPEMAKDILLALEKENHPYIYLLLADIYQYHLNDKKSAITYLNKFNDREYNEQTIKRLKELEDDI